MWGKTLNGESSCGLLIWPWRRISHDKRSLQHVVHSLLASTSRNLGYLVLQRLFVLRYQTRFPNLGNKILKSVFIKINSSHERAALESHQCGSQVGYYMAAVLIHHKFHGRRRIQSIGVLTVSSSFPLPPVTTESSTERILFVLFLLASIWFQLYYIRSSPPRRFIQRY